MWFPPQAKSIFYIESKLFLNDSCTSPKLPSTSRMIPCVQCKLLVIFLYMVSCFFQIIRLDGSFPSYLITWKLSTKTWIENPRNSSLLGEYIDVGGQQAYQFLARNIQRNGCYKAYSKKPLRHTIKRWVKKWAANKFRFPRKSIIKREIKYFAPTFGRFSYFYSFFERILVAVYDGQFL